MDLECCCAPARLIWMRPQGAVEAERWTWTSREAAWRRRRALAGRARSAWSGADSLHRPGAGEGSVGRPCEVAGKEDPAPRRELSLAQPRTATKRRVSLPGQGGREVSVLRRGGREKVYERGGRSVCGEKVSAARRKGEDCVLGVRKARTTTTATDRRGTETERAQKLELRVPQEVAGVPRRRDGGVDPRREGEGREGLGRRGRRCDGREEGEGGARRAEGLRRGARGRAHERRVLGRRRLGRRRRRGELLGEEVVRVVVRSRIGEGRGLQKERRQRRAPARNERRERARTNPSGAGPAVDGVGSSDDDARLNSDIDSAVNAGPNGMLSHGRARGTRCSTMATARRTMRVTLGTSGRVRTKWRSSWSWRRLGAASA